MKRTRWRVPGWLITGLVLAPYFLRHGIATVDPSLMKEPGGQVLLGVWMVSNLVSNLVIMGLLLMAVFLSIRWVVRKVRGPGDSPAEQTVGKASS